LIRRLRAILVIALIWAGAWLPVGALLIATHILDTDRPFLGLAIWTAWGGVSGAAFALVLAVSERRASFSQLSLARFMTWGAVGGLILPVAWMLFDSGGPVVWQWDYWWPALVVLALSALLGSICAAATALLARRGSPRDGSSLTSA
jgi:hypothetical protein